MNPYVEFVKIWEDDDMYELAISVCDGRSTFSTDMYLGIGSAKDLNDGLKQFSKHMYGGLYDFKIGEFGPEYASGALQIRFEFHRSGNGKLFMTATGESEWFESPHTRVASSSRQYLITESALFDEFIKQFSGLANGNRKEAKLDCVK